MNLLERFIHFFEGEMETPTNYSWFHLMFIGIVILFTVFLCLKFKDCDDKIFRRITLICWITIVALEILKQLVFSFEFDGTNAVWDYQWYAFPYQFCSTPLYVLPFIAFLKEGKLRDSLVAYMAFFSMFAGLAVFFYPNDVFIATIVIDIQTMVHHGLQIALGIFFAVHSRHKFKLSFHLWSIPVFAVLVTIAIVANEVVFKLLSANGIDETFNMFYISRHFDCTLPVLSGVYTAVPYFVFALIYILGFAVVSFIVYYVEKLIISLVERKKSQNAEQNKI